MDFMSEKARESQRARERATRREREEPETHDDLPIFRRERSDRDALRWCERVDDGDLDLRATSESVR